MSIFCLLLVSLISICYSYDIAQYECGPHGRFEYCIDGIPGCVIGCHCHPGYYFDTDTKVCEPNIKLTKDSRRNYPPEPTRIPNTIFDSQIVTTDLIPTLTNPVESKIDEITKDADDLGDWLYNQFFKTIENQVINSTDDNEHLLNRRSDSVVKKKLKRRSRKHGKKMRKKSKRKKHGLKKKLLRITEDDSLFDSSSRSASYEDSSSSSSESEIDTSSDSDKNDKDHGHKKIVIFNKKPKPPLPSFIFLPNMDTPFYPPIGLPPPPVVPMYPFVPVPPVAPFIPYAGITTHCDDNEASISTIPPSQTPPTKTTITAISTPTATTATPNNGGTTTTTVASTLEPASSTTNAHSDPTTAKPSLRSRDSPLYGKMLNNKNRYAQRNKLRLKDKINRRNKLTKTKSFTDDYIDMEEAQAEATISKHDYIRQLQSNGIEEEMPMEDVDFKYLTELIHRVDFNNTRNQLQYPMNPKIPSGGRRNYDSDPKYFTEPIYPYHLVGPHRQRTIKTDDTYYSNLGRQIASMIRKIDAHGDRQINIEVEKETIQSPQHPIFSENSHASRSFWERSVRSPLKTYFEPRDSTFSFLKHSNENLFNLENIVAVAVTTNPPLSLREIENVLYKIDSAGVTVQKANSSVMPTPSQRSFNVNLLAKNSNWIKNVNRNLISTTKYEDVTPHDTFILYPVNDRNSKLSKSIPIIKTEPKVVFYAPNTPNVKLSKNGNNHALKIPMIGYLKFINQPPSTTKRPIDYRLNLKPYNFKKSDYYTNNNQYVHGEPSYPYYSSKVFRNYNPPIANPSRRSYFHDELHNFGYFDQ